MMPPERQPTVNNSTLILFSPLIFIHLANDAGKLTGLVSLAALISLSKFLSELTRRRLAGPNHRRSDRWRRNQVAGVLVCPAEETCSRYDHGCWSRVASDLFASWPARRLIGSSARLKPRQKSRHVSRNEHKKHNLRACWPHSPGGGGERETDSSRSGKVTSFSIIKVLPAPSEFSFLVHNSSIILAVDSRRALMWCGGSSFSLPGCGLFARCTGCPGCAPTSGNIQTHTPSFSNLSLSVCPNSREQQMK